jgi:hypothetical protein
MLAFMARLTMHTGHQVAYLQIFIMAYLFRCLFQATCPTDPMLWKTMYCVFIRESPWWWPLLGRRTHTIGDSQLCFLRFDSNEVNHAPVGWWHSLSPGSPPDSTVEYKQGMAFYS